MKLRFSARETWDLLVAWVALGIAFAIFFAGGGTAILERGLVLPLVVSMLTAGVGFLLHEIAHKVVAIRFGQVAEFRADYSMLFIAIMSALVGFLFAAPGAVHHRGYLTDRQHGLIALAGPVTNLLLAVVFAPVWMFGLANEASLLALLGGRGIAINLFLAAFNLIPFGSLDGKTVVGWSKLVWLVTFLLSAALVFVVVFVLGVGIGGGIGG